MKIMNLVEKRDFIHSHLHRANEKMINEFYEKLRKEVTLVDKLERRALNAEEDIKKGRVYSRDDIEM